MQQFKLKLFDLGKTRTNNASSDMFNFYVVLAGRDKAGLSQAGENSKPLIYKRTSKIEGPSENICFKGKHFEDFRRKKKEQKPYSRAFENYQWDTKTLKPSTEIRPCKKLNKT